MAFAALDKNKTLHIYADSNIGRATSYSKPDKFINPYEKTYENVDVIDFEIGFDAEYHLDFEPRFVEYMVELRVIDSTRTLRLFGDSKAIQEDVACLTDGYFVTKSGTIGTDDEVTNKKTRVHDVWLERK